MNERTMRAPGVGRLTRDLLEWIAASPRSYGEAMEAWRTSCPRLSIWDDAMRDGLIEIINDGRPRSQASIALTARGRAALGDGQ